MYPSGWPDLITIDGVEFRYVRDDVRILQALAGANKANSTWDWLGVIAYAMDDDSQRALIRSVQNFEISGNALMILANRIANEALGLDLLAASSLAATSLSSWFQIAAWAAGKGLRISDLDIHELLPAAYSIQIEQCKEDRDVASLNRRVFGRAHPWGR